jgi:hypothetical protein
VNETIKKTDGMYKTWTDRLILYSILKLEDIIDSFVESLIKFLLIVLFVFIMNLAIYGFRNLSSSSQDGFSFWNSNEISYHLITNDPLWIIESKFLYAMSHFLCGMENLIWVKFSLMKHFLKNLSIIFNDMDWSEDEVPVWW